MTDSGFDWTMITAAVPAVIGDVSGWPVERRVKEADRCADIIASGADVLRVHPARAAKAEITPGQVVDAVVTGLAILACRSGGAGFLGMHWHAVPGRCIDCPGAGIEPLFAMPAHDAATGAFFTPRELADDVVANALAVIIQPLSLCAAADIEALRVVDPFCGSGAFLLAAARYLSAALAAAWAESGDEEAASLCTVYGTADPAMAARALVVSQCLHGVDLDPLSVELAGLALQLLAPECSSDLLLEVDEEDYERHVASKGTSSDVTQHARLVRPAGPPTGRVRGLRAGDSLVGRLRDPLGSWPPVPAPVHWPAVFPDVFEDRGGFDAVLGNPPFLGGNKVNGELGQDYRDHLISTTASGKRTIVDLAVYCWARMHQLASPYGVVGIIGPHALLGGANVKLAAALLDCDGWRPYRLTRTLSWPGRTAAVSVCAVWTHQCFGADPPDEIGNVPELAPPAHLWQLSRIIEAEGQAIGVWVPVSRRGPAQVAMFGNLPSRAVSSQ